MSHYCLGCMGLPLINCRLYWQGKALTLTLESQFKGDRCLISSWTAYIESQALWEGRSGLPGSGNHWAEINPDFHLPCPTPSPQSPFSLPCNSSTENGSSWWYLHAKHTHHSCGLIQKIGWRRNSLSCDLSTYIISSTLSLGLKSLILQYLLSTSL